MKFGYWLLASLMLCAALPASAQISIDKVDSKKENVQFKNEEVKTTSVDAAYFSRARYRAERAAIRQERNYLEFSSGVKGTLTSYNDPWVSVSGGDNSITLMSELFLNHIFKKNNFSIETKATARLGYNRMKVESTDSEGNVTSNGIWFKNQDLIDISVAPSFKFAKNWSYGTVVQFRSQFTKGYKSRTEQHHEHLKSCFMTPGYLDISLGLTYKSPHKKWPFSINFSPVAMSATFAENDWIRRAQYDAEDKLIKPAYAYGIEDPAKTSKYEGGSSIQIDYDRTFGRSGFLRYKTMFYSFYGWISNLGLKNKYPDYHEYLEAYEQWSAGPKEITEKPHLPIHPIVRWTNRLSIKATKYLSTDIDFELYYNRAQNYSVQTKTILSVGLTYVFKNKEKK